jgi:hypothetical protein
MRTLVSTTVLGVAVVMGTAARGVDGPGNEELLKKVEALEAEVKKLRAAQERQARTAPYDPRDVDATIEAVRKNATQHSLLFPPGSAGHNFERGFFIRSDDGQFVLYPDLMVQFRGVAAYREDAKHGESSTENGFEIRRAKIGFYGTAFGPDLSYRFLWQSTNSNGGNLVLQYGWGQYLLAHDLLGERADFGFRAGQFKNIVFREETIIDRSQMFTERSLANATLGGAALGSETQGVDFLLTGVDAPFHTEFLVHDGIRSSNTDFKDNQPVVNPITGTTTNVATDWGLAGRVDYKLFGRWSDADDLTGVWGRQDLLILGGGVDVTECDHLLTVHWTTDVQYQMFHKLSLLAGVYGVHTNFRNQAGPSDRNDIGGQIEVGYFVTEAVQPIVRYSLTKFDKSFKVGGEDTFTEIAGGVNWFFGPNGEWGNNAKITVDLTYLPNGSPAFPGGDFLASPNGKAEVVLRGQFQISF